MIKIRNKTELRKQIMEAKGTSGEWDSIEFYSDGDWERRNCSTYSTGAVARHQISSLLVAINSWDCCLSTQKTITSNFREIENCLNE